MEFHQCMQSQESVEQLGLDLMSLVQRAFPSLGGTERDRLLKGRFFQALLPKWQRKLGAPKVSETFSDLYERARTCERHSQQFGFNREPGKTKPRSVTPSDQDNHVEHSNKPRNIKCFLCGVVGHMKRDCSQKTETKADRSEAPGKHSSKPTISTATVGVSEASLDPTPLFDGFSDEQLEAALTARRCSKEQSLLCNSEISTVIAQGNASAVGPTLVLEVSIEGVLVPSMVDTGSQCSIISRNMLQSIGKHLKGQGKDWPKLQPASAKLYGKDGKTGGHELDITAQVTFTVEADGFCPRTFLYPTR